MDRSGVEWGWETRKKAIVSRRGHQVRQGLGRCLPGVSAPTPRNAEPSDTGSPLLPSWAATCQVIEITSALELIIALASCVMHEPLRVATSFIFPAFAFLSVSGVCVCVSICLSVWDGGRKIRLGTTSWHHSPVQEP